MSIKLGEPSSSVIRDCDLFQDLKHLEPLDEILRCRICCEYFNVCMMTACSHNYCSLCIRKYMTYKAQCPTCFQETSEPELRNNRLIDDIVKAYKAVRESCELYYQGYVRSSSDNSCSIDSGPTVQKKNKAKEQEIDTSTDCIIEVSQQSTASENKVSCPVCSILILEKNINLHLDSCLLQKENTSASPSKVKRASLAKVVYHLLSDRDLRKKLKECGLSTAGDRQALIRRHKNFLVAYNSECDSLNPKPVSEIIKIVEVEEMAERKHEKQTRVFQFDKRSEPEVIEQQQLMYMKQHRQQYNELIEDVHLRRQQKMLENDFASDPEVSVVENSSSLCSSSKLMDEFAGKESGSGLSFAVSDATDSILENDAVEVTSLGENEVILLDENDWAKDTLSCEDVISKDSPPPDQPKDIKINRKQVSNLRKRKIVEHFKKQNESPDQKK